MKLAGSRYASGKGGVERERGDEGPRRDGGGNGQGGRHREEEWMNWISGRRVSTEYVAGGTRERAVGRPAWAEGRRNAALH